MKIWVDADSCPVEVRRILARASEREEIPLKLVANRAIPFGDSPYTEMVVVGKDPEATDNFILENAKVEDMVITRDIPLAFRLLEGGVVVLNDRGGRFTPNEIREKLSLRNTMEEMRFAGLATDGQSRFGFREIRDFANCFDRELRKLLGGRD